MSRFVLDASVAIKCVVHEDGSDDASAVLDACPLSAPDLLVAECANILWKKVRRQEISQEQATLGAVLLQSADIELLPTRHLMEAATRLAIELNHPAYDCIYLALAAENHWPFITADMRLLRKVNEATIRTAAVVTMAEALTQHATQLKGSEADAG